MAGFPVYQQQPALSTERRPSQGGDSCEECQRLYAYSVRRIDRYPFRTAKPACANCTIHYYRNEERDQIKKVMRFSGPRC
ncbi:MAG: nitrous oxide-stimulated promoter family protein [Spirochaetia bacterium]